LSGDKFIREGKEGFTLSIDLPVSMQVKLRSFNQRKGRVFMADENGNIYGTSPDGTIIKGLTVQELHVGKMETAGDSNSRFVKVKVILRNTFEQADYGVIFKPTDFNPYELDGVYDVILAKVSAATTGINFSVTIDQLDPSDPLGQVTGLVKADFVLKKAGVAVTTFTVADAGDGTYTFTPTAAFSTGDYTLDLVACASVSLVDQAIEEVAALAFTIA
jgi:hypothetical protein